MLLPHVRTFVNDEVAVLASLDDEQNLQTHETHKKVRDLSTFDQRKNIAYVQIVLNVVMVVAWSIAKSVLFVLILLLTRHRS